MTPELNEGQKKAVTTNGQSLLIIAGAGTGKTRVIVEKVIHLISEGIPGNSILALTFTNKASDEMRERIASRCPSQHAPFIGTFHSFCVSLLREFYTEAGVSAQFTIFDREASRRVLKRCMKSEGVGDFAPRVIQNTIGRLKTGLADGARDDVVRVAEKMLPIYTLEMEREMALDFDDLLIKTIQMLQAYPRLRQEIRLRYTYIFVDEFQDTDLLQNQLVSLLKGEKTAIVAVGDTDQTIYSWRGANVGNMLSFPEQYAPVSTILLTQNYRSTDTILSAANAIIAKNILRQEKNLFTARKGGNHISLITASDEEDEAGKIARTIVRMHEGGVGYGDIAVLFRANFQARALETHMIVNRVPYIVLGSRFFDRSEIKDLLAYLTLTQNPNSREAFIRAAGVPRRGVGARTLERIFAGEEGMLSGAARGRVGKLQADIAHINAFAKQHTVSETLREIITLLNYKEHLVKMFDNPDERMKEVDELVVFANRFSEMSGADGIAQLLSEVALSSDQDTLRTDARNAVRLMTIHAAKGLEFPCVFIAGMEEGLFPYISDEEGVRDEEEERRLCYVAMTRAKDTLYCSFARRRGMFGSYRSMRPSSFLHDIPEHLIDGGEGVGSVKGGQTSHFEGADSRGVEDIEW